MQSLRPTLPLTESEPMLGRVPRQCPCMLSFKGPLQSTACFPSLGHGGGVWFEMISSRRISQANINYLKDVKITQTIQKCGVSKPLGHIRTLAPTLKSYFHLISLLEEVDTGQAFPFLPRES